MHMKILAQLLMLLGIPSINFKQKEKRKTKTNKTQQNKNN